MSYDGYTLSQLRSKVLRQLRVTDTTRYSPTAGATDYDWIDDALNNGQEEFVRRTTCLRSYGVIQLKADYRNYRLPPDFIDLAAAYYFDSTLSDGYKKLTVNTIDELNNEVSDWRTESGTPSRIYVDNMLGSTQICGFYPIPETDGADVEFDPTYGFVSDEWVCPIFALTKEAGIGLLRVGTEYYMNIDPDVVAKIISMDKNVLLEYYRLATQLTNEEQYPDIAKEYHKALSNYATFDLLSNNPEDSAEFQRSASFLQLFEREVNTFINRRKRPLLAKEGKARPASWNWIQNMGWYRGIH